jgi:two-component system sporulation sensor kinase B
MKNKNTQINQKLYYSTVLVVIALMILGLFVGNPLLQHLGPGFIMHGVLVFLFSICLLIYPLYKSHHFLKIIIIVVVSTYFYTIFLLYPNTWSNFIFLCFIPATSILFFDSKLFHLSLLLNTFSIIILFSYIAIVDRGDFYISVVLNMFNLVNVSQGYVGDIVNAYGSDANLMRLTKNLDTFTVNMEGKTYEFDYFREVTEESGDAVAATLVKESLENEYGRHRIKISSSSLNRMGGN